MFIMNDRVNGDKHVGEFKCKYAAVVDCCIANVTFLSFVEQFFILTFAPLLSGGHKPLQVALHVKMHNTQRNITNNERHMSSEIPRRWRHNKNKTKQITNVL